LHLNTIIYNIIANCTVPQSAHFISFQDTEIYLYSKYGQKVVRYKYIQDDMYQAYIISNGK